jgi:hypothetical protein
MNIVTINQAILVSIFKIIPRKKIPKIKQWHHKNCQYLIAMINFHTIKNQIKKFKKIKTNKKNLNKVVLFLLLKSIDFKNFLGI